MHIWNTGLVIETFLFLQTQLLYKYYLQWLCHYIISDKNNSTKLFILSYISKHFLSVINDWTQHTGTLSCFFAYYYGFQIHNPLLFNSWTTV